MKTLTFTYTKKDSSVSSRTLLAMVTPADFYAGVDLSELDASEANEFIKSAKQLHDEYLQKLTELQKSHDLKFAFRKFLVSGMSDINEI